MDRTAGAREALRRLLGHASSSRTRAMTGAKSSSARTAKYVIPHRSRARRISSAISSTVPISTYGIAASSVAVIPSPIRSATRRERLLGVVGDVDHLDEGVQLDLVDPVTGAGADLVDLAIEMCDLPLDRMLVSVGVGPAESLEPDDVGVCPGVAEQRCAVPADEDRQVILERARHRCLEEPVVRARDA